MSWPDLTDVRVYYNPVVTYMNARGPSLVCVTPQSSTENPELHLVVSSVSLPLDQE